MWGQVTGFTLAIKELRIIPTRVGTSCHSKFLPVQSPDHPHACGDKQIVDKKSLTNEGSSPRVWGQERKSLTAKAKRRIIPTRVGTSSILFPRTLFGGDHPHACGDKVDIYDYITKKFRIIPTRVGTSLCDRTTRNRRQGSSPRVWGQDYITSLWICQGGIIPTRVGTSACD